MWKWEELCSGTLGKAKLLVCKGSVLVWIAGPCIFLISDTYQC